MSLLVNNAGVGYYGLHEELNVAEDTERVVRTNLEVPMVLTNLLLQDLKKYSGTVINISSVTAQLSNPHQAVLMGQRKRDSAAFPGVFLMRCVSMVSVL